MRILFVTHLFPYPPTDGGRIAFFNSIKYLSRIHNIGLVTLASHEDTKWLPELQKYCSTIRTFEPRAEGKIRVALRGACGYPPGTAAKYWDPRFGQFVRQTFERFRPEIVEFHHLNTAVYGKFVTGVPKILREHNVEYKVWERHAIHAARATERAFVKLCIPRVKSFEAKMAAQFDRCITVSEADERYLKSVAPQANICTIPFGVDTEYFQPAPSSAVEEPYSLVLTGSFEWKPKQHNLRILLNEIFPRIQARLPQAKLYVVGKGVPDDIRKQHGGRPGITITGTVDDVRPYIQRASLLLNYLESGGGIALKVLEAMAMRKPVLSNSLGCEGIAAKHGVHVYLADQPEEFANAATLLLDSSEIRDKLAENGNLLVLERYSWNVLARQLTACYSEITSTLANSHKEVLRTGV
jgi:glycosyltransferase involved in cell wall biosynthesis